MNGNDKQNKLHGLEAIARSISFSDLVNELIDAHGLQPLANELGIDKSQLSRFRSGQIGFTLEQIEKLLDFSGIILIQKNRYKRTISTCLTLSEWIKDAVGWDI